MTGDRLTADQMALVQAALASGEEAVGHWRRFTDLYEFEDIWDGERYSMLPAVHRALQGAAVAEAPRLAGIHRRNWVANQTALRHCLEVVSLLAEGGVDACLHGDLAVAETLYRDPASRVIETAEILVSAEAIPTAVDTLSTAGWRRDDTHPLSALIDRTDGLIVTRADRDRVRLVWETCRGVADSQVDRRGAAAVINLSTPLSTDQGDVPVTAPEALAVHALCAGVGWRPQRRRRSLCDTAMLIGGGQGISNGLDYEAVIADIERLGVATVAAHELRAAAEITGRSDDDFAAAVADMTVPPADRRRHQWLIRTTDRPGRIRALRAEFSRSVVGRGSVSAAGSAPEFLRSRWGLQSAALIPVEAVRRAAGRASRPRPPTRVEAQ
jgi:hypothetical protein